MLRIYHLDFFISYCLSTKVSVRICQKGWLFSCHLIIGRYVKDLLPENVFHVLFKYENKWKFIPKGMAVQLPPINR